MIKPRDIQKLRRLGLTDVMPDGTERVRVSLHTRREPAAGSYAALKSEMRDWKLALASMLAPLGADIVEDSLSVTGRSVDVLVPIRELARLTESMAPMDTSVDLVVERKATL